MPEDPPERTYNDALAKLRNLERALGSFLTRVEEAKFNAIPSRFERDLELE